MRPGNRAPLRPYSPQRPSRLAKVLSTTGRQPTIHHNALRLPIATTESPRHGVRPGAARRPSHRPVDRRRDARQGLLLDGAPRGARRQRPPRGVQDHGPLCAQRRGAREAEALRAARARRARGRRPPERRQAVRRRVRRRRRARVRGGRRRRRAVRLPGPARPRRPPARGRGARGRRAVPARAAAPARPRRRAPRRQARQHHGRRPAHARQPAPVPARQAHRLQPERARRIGLGDARDRRLRALLVELGVQRRHPRRAVRHHRRHHPPQRLAVAAARHERRHRAGQRRLGALRLGLWDAARLLPVPEHLHPVARGRDPQHLRAGAPAGHPPHIPRRDLARRARLHRGRAGPRAPDDCRGHAAPRVARAAGQGRRGVPAAQPPRAGAAGGVRRAGAGRRRRRRVVRRRAAALRIDLVAPRHAQLGGGREHEAHPGVPAAAHGRGAGGIHDRRRRAQPRAQRRGVLRSRSVPVAGGRAGGHCPVGLRARRGLPRVPLREQRQWLRERGQRRSGRAPRRAEGMS